MAVLAGIDLLGKYLEGDDIKTTVTVRFKKYYERYFDNAKDYEIIYQLRNSLLHSFGLYSFKIKNGVKEKEFYFILDRHDDGIIVKLLEHNKYNINITALFEAFEKSIKTYFSQLQDDIDLQKKFEKMFYYYNGIRIG